MAREREKKSGKQLAVKRARHDEGPEAKPAPDTKKTLKPSMLATGLVNLLTNMNKGLQGNVYQSSVGLTTFLD